MSMAASIQMCIRDRAQVEWTTTKQSYRVWVPLDAIDCPNLYE